MPNLKSNFCGENFLKSNHPSQKVSESSVTKVWLAQYNMPAILLNKMLGHKKNYIILLQNAKKCRYRFSLLVDELRGAESDAYRTTILGFINSIILYTDRIEDRVRIRNEFIGKLIHTFYIWQFALTTTRVLAKLFLWKIQ